jgi:hypothetical protein
MNNLTREELNFLSAALSAYKFWEHTSRENAPSGKSFFDIQDEIKGKISNAVAGLGHPNDLGRVRVTWRDAVKEGRDFESRIAWVIARRSGAMDLRFIDDEDEGDWPEFTFQQRGVGSDGELLWIEQNEHKTFVTIESL